MNKTSIVFLSLSLGYGLLAADYEQLSAEEIGRAHV